MGPGILRDTIDKRLVPKILECFLVFRVKRRPSIYYQRVNRMSLTLCELHDWKMFADLTTISLLRSLNVTDFVTFLC